MTEPNTRSQDEDLIGPIIESFLEQFRKGERPALKDLIARYPDLADELQEIIPALVNLEQLGGGTASFSGKPSAATRLNEADHPERLGDYRIIRRIGHGGMGVVYEAEHESLKSRVALKVMHPRFRTDEKYVRRFHVEARSAAALHHTNIVSVFDYGEQDGVFYYAMQFIRGQPLDVVLQDLIRLRKEPADPARPTASARNAPASPSDGFELRTVAQSLLTGGFLAEPSSDPSNQETGQFEPGQTQKQSDASPSAKAKPSPEVPDPAPPAFGSSSLGGSIEGRYYREVARICAQVADALAYAHRAGVLHRDIKPSNLILDALGNVWITDFGLAKFEEGEDASESKDLVGTMRYMAPERFEGVSNRGGDLYALGATLYELVTLKPAFDGTDQLRLIHRIVNDPPVSPRLIDPRVPRDLETIVMKTLAKNPKDRFGRAQDLTEELRKFVDGVPIRSRRISPLERSWRWCARNPAVAILSTAVILMLVFSAIGSALSTVHFRRAAEENRELAVRWYVDAGTRTLDAGDPLGSLPWFAEALRRDGGDPIREREHRIRLASVLSICPRLEQAWPHPGGALSVRFSPDGRRVFSTGEDRVARVWETETGASVHSKPLTHTSLVRDAILSPDGTRIATIGTDGTARIWDAVTGTSLQTLRHGATSLKGVAFHPDGSLLLTGSVDGRAILWDVATGAMRHVVEHGGPVLSVAFSPDGRLAASAGGDGIVRLFSPKGETVRTLKHGGPVRSVVFRYDGLRVLTASQDHLARSWDPATGKELVQFAHDGGQTYAEFSPDGSRVVTGSFDGAARVWNAETGAAVTDKLGSGGIITHAMFSPDGRFVATASDDKTARVFDAATGNAVARLPHGGSVMKLAFSPDGKRLATASYDGLVRVWRLGQGATRQDLVHDPGTKLLRALFSPDGRRVVTSDVNGLVRVWDAETLQPIAKLQHAGAIRSMAISPDGRRIVTAGDDAAARVWDTETGAAITPPLKHDATVWHAEFSPDGHHIVTASGQATCECTATTINAVDESRGPGLACVFDAETGRSVLRVKHSSVIFHAAFSPDGRRIVTVSVDNHTRVWDARSGRLLLTKPREDTPIFATFSPDGRQIATSGNGRFASIFDSETGRRLAELEHGGAISRVEYRLDGRRLLTTSDDGSARVWDTETWEPATPPLAHSLPLFHAAFSPSGMQVVTVSDDHTARVWDTETGAPLTPFLPHNEEVRHAGFSPDGERIVTAPLGDTARIWTLHPDTQSNEELIRLAEVLSGHRTNPKGILMPLRADELLARWRKLRNRPQSLPPSPPLRTSNMSRIDRRPAAARADRARIGFVSHRSRVGFEPLEDRMLLAGAPISWESRGAGGGGALFGPQINPANPADIYITSDMSQEFHTRDGGATWGPIDFHQLQTDAATTIQFTEVPGLLYARDAGALDPYTTHPAKSVDGGQTWTLLPNDPTSGDTYQVLADPANHNHLLVSSYDTLYASSDGGTTWAQAFQTTDENVGLFIAGAFFDGQNIYVGTSKGLVVSADAGATFSVSTAGGIADGQGIYGFAGSKQGGVTRLVAVTRDASTIYGGITGTDYQDAPGTVLTLDVGQPNWVPKMTGLPSTLYINFVGMAANNISTVYLAGGSDASTPTVFKTNNAGTSWSNVLKTTNNRNIQTGWSGDGGDRDWTYGEVVLGLAVANNDVKHIVITDLGFAHESTDGGTTWHNLNVAPADRNPMNALTPVGLSYHDTGLDNTSSWGVTWVDSNRVIVSNSDVRAENSNDGGKTFGFAYTGDDYNSNYRTVVNATTGTVYAAMSSVHDLYQSTRIEDDYIDGGQGAVMFSNDKGTTWQIMHDFQHPVVWVATDPNNPNRLYASVVNSGHGGIFVTNNADQGSASTWTKLTDPPRTKGHPFNIVVLSDGTLVVTYSARRSGNPTNFSASSGVFMSTDGGQTWLDRTAPGMKYWTNDLIVDPSDTTGSTWLAGVYSGWGGKANDLGGLYRTTDRGVTWTRIHVFTGVTSATFVPGHPDALFVTTMEQGLWYTDNVHVANPIFTPVTSYAFHQPLRVAFNPSDPTEVWVTSFGDGLQVGHLTPFNNQSPVADDRYVTVSATGETTVTLAGQDAETPASALVYTVTSLPDQGVLVKSDGSAVHIGDTFTANAATLTYLLPPIITAGLSTTFQYTVTDTGDAAHSSGSALTSLPATVRIGTLAFPKGGVWISGTSGGDTIDVTHTADNTQLQVTINGALAANTIPLTSVQQIRLFGHGGDDILRVTDLAKLTYLDGGAGNNQLILAGTSGNDRFTIGGSSVVYNGAAFTASGRLTVAGLAGNDTFVINGAPAWVNIDGGDGADSVFLTDDTDFTLSNSLLTTAHGASVGLSNVETAYLTGGASANRFDLSGWTGNGTIRGAGGANTVTAVKDANFTLSNAALSTSDGMAMTLSGITIANLTGGASANSFNVGGWNAAGTISGGGAPSGSPDTVTLVRNTNFTLSNIALKTTDGMNLTLSGVTNVALGGGLSSNTFTVSGWSGTASINGGSGGSDRLIGPDQANSWLINGINTGTLNTGITFQNILNLTGGAANDTFTFNPGATLAGSINGGTGTNTIDLSAITTPISVNMPSSRVTGLSGTFTAIQSIIGGSSVSNSVTGPAANTTYFITALNTFNVNGLSFSNFRKITGGAGENTFALSNGAGLSGGINGGSAGNSWLDYSAYTTDLTVNLSNGSATGFGAAISNIANVRGGSGNDKLTGNTKGNILIGGGGNDTLTGGTGLSLLIGGIGADAIKGGSGGDLIIGGSTSYDGNNAALDSILAEWRSADDYATRINFIKNGGGLNGTNVLNLGTTVIDDLASNVLTGAPGGKNWYFKGTKDTITDLQAGEQVN